MTVFKNIEVTMSTKNLSKFKADIKDARDAIEGIGSKSTKSAAETKTALNALDGATKNYGSSVKNLDQTQQQSSKKTTDAIKQETAARKEAAKAADDAGKVGGSKQASTSPQSKVQGINLETAALAGLAGSLADAEEKTTKFSKETEKSIGDASENSAADLTTIGTAALAVTAGLSGAFALSTRASMNFAAVMSEVGAVSNASADDLLKLKEAALQAGQATIFTATDAAQAESELAKAGISVRDILGGGLKGVLDLAAAGQLSVAEAATTAASAMTVFGLSGRDVTHIADLLARGSNTAQGGVHDFAQALNQSALVAKQFGLSLDETVTGLTLFARSGFIGSDAGTSFKSMLLSLASPSKIASDTMKQFGINVYDASGSFIGFSETAEVLKKQLSGVDEQSRNFALSTIFGTDAIRVANLLYREGADGIARMGDTMNDQASAAELAAQKTDNLKGDLEQLKGAIETSLIRTGDNGTSAMRSLTQSATSFVNAIGEVPGPVQKVGLGLGVLVGTGTLAVGIVGTMIPKFQALHLALNNVHIGSINAGSALVGFTKFLGVASVAMAAGAAVYMLYASHQAEMKQSTEGLTEAIKEEARGVKGAVDNQLLDDLAKSKTLSLLRDLKLNQTDVNGAILGNADAQKRVYDQILATNPKLRENADAQKILRDALGGSTDAAAAFKLVVAQLDLDPKTNKALTEMFRLSDVYRGSTEEVRQLSMAQGQLGSTSDETAGALAGVGGAAGEAAGGVRELTEEEKSLADAFTAFGTPASAFQDAMSLAQDAARDAAQAATEAQNKAQSGQKKALSAQQTEQRNALKAQQKLDLDAAQDRKAAVSSKAKDTKAAIGDEIDALKARQTAELQSFDASKGTYAGAKATVADYAASVTVSLHGYIEQLQKQNIAEEAWASNLTKVATRYGTDVATELAKLGKDAAPLVQQFASSTAVEGQKAADAIRKSLDLSSAGAEQATYWRIIETQARLGATATVQSIATALELKVADVQGIAAKYGLALIDAAASVGVVTFGKTPGFENATGDVDRELNVRRYADGGVEDHSAQIAPAGAMRLWAEPETGGEAYIPLAAGKRGRSLALLQKVAVDHFGMDPAAFAMAQGARAFASGGILGAIPKPPKLSGAVVEAMANKTMADSYAAVIKQAEAAIATSAGASPDLSSRAC